MHHSDHKWHTLSSLRFRTLPAFTAIFLILMTWNIASLRAQETPQAKSRNTLPGAGIAPTVNQAGPTGFAATGNGIDYHGGPLMTGAHNLYYIWYGSWGGNSALTILPTLGSSLGNSLYFGIDTTYENSTSPVQNIGNAVTMSAQVFDSYSQGTVLDESKVQAIVSRALGTIAPDPNGVYFVLTSSDVNETSHGGFCVGHCGYHGHATLGGTDIKYAFIGDGGDRCPFQCEIMNFSASPNNNTGADEMASVIAHELSETVTDPHLDAWFTNSTGQENADKCAYTYGSTFTTANGSAANITLGGLNFLIQQNWLNDGGGACTMAFKGNPFLFANATDQRLSCQGIAGRTSGTCGSIGDSNDRLYCQAVASASQTPCTSMNDRNLQLSCFGIAFAPNFPSNCRDISNPQMQSFCYGVSSGGTMGAPNCSTVTDSATQALCNAMAQHNSLFCSGISNSNDRQFCLGVSAHDTSACSSIM